MSRKAKVLIIDDSAPVRQTMAGLLGDDPDINVIGDAPDPSAAAGRLAIKPADVILFGLESPRTEGITLLRTLTAQHPIPVVLFTSLGPEDSTLLVKALHPCPVDVIQKPSGDPRRFLVAARLRICRIVKAAAGLRPRRSLQDGALFAFPPEEKLSADVILPAAPCRCAASQTTDPIVCIGASTGGTDSLRVVLEGLPSDCPGVVIVQHMPGTFTGPFARRLNGACAMEVKEAADGDPVHRGRVLIAPGNRHTLLQRSGGQYYVSVKDGPPVSRHRPSVDVLFRSAAQSAGHNAIGVIMTGMGDDGARGLLEMHQTGAHTLAQDEATSVVFGMPREAIALGGVDKVAPLPSLPSLILLAARR